MSKWIPLIKKIYFSYRGRLDRKRYFVYTIGLVIIWIGIFILSALINAALGKVGVRDDGMLFNFVLWCLALTSIPLMLLFARRLHDINVTGIFMFTILIPPINIIFFIAMSVLKGTEGKNDFGDDPTEVEGLMPIVADKQNEFEIKLSQVPEEYLLDDPLNKVNNIISKILQNNYGKMGLAVCVIAIVMCIGSFIGDDYNQGDKIPTPPAMPVAPVKNAAEVQISPSNVNQNTVNQRDITVNSELSLGGLVLGDTEEIVQRLYGAPDKREKEGKYVRWYYSNIQVVMLNGKVHALVSRNDQVSTKRGFHEKSTMNAVVASYGNEASKYEEGGLIIYEYKFNSDIGIDGLLRYAFNKADNSVNYISVRIPDEWLEQESSEEAAAKMTLVSYHKAISEHNFNMAYDLMSPKRQASMGEISHFAEGYKDTISSEPMDIKVQSLTKDEIVLTYRLNARDKTNSNKVYVQQFECKSSIFKVEGKWLLGYTEAKKISEKYE